MINRNVNRGGRPATGRQARAFPRLRVAGLLLIGAGALTIAPAQESTAPTAPAANAAAASTSSATTDEQSLADRIDAVLAAAWETEGLTPASPVDDAGFLRRLSIDLRGEIARADEVAEFLADSRPDKRARKIDEFLHDPRFADQLSGRWTKLLLSAGGKNFARMTPYLRNWLAQAFQRGQPFGAIVRSMLSDDVAAMDPGPSSLVIAYHDSIETLTSVTARAFLGLQIQCAQCHDHPFDRWKRDDFNRFAAFFTDMRAEFARVEENERLEGDMQPYRTTKKESKRDKVVNERMEKMGGGAGMSGMGHGGSAMSDDAEAKMGSGFRVLDTNPERDLGDRLHRLLVLEKIAEHRKLVEGEPDPAKSPEKKSKMGAKKALTERTDRDAVFQLAAIFRDTERGFDPMKALEKEPGKFDTLVAALAPDARELVDRYLDRRKLFSTAGYPDGTKYETVKGVTKRRALADWIASPENPWFGRAIANKVWQQLFDKGLVEPVDDLSGSKDQVAPELLDELAREFFAHGSDFRFLFGAIARTRAYALANSMQGNELDARHETRWFAAHPVRALTVEQMANSLLCATAPQAARTAPDGGLLEDANSARRTDLIDTLSASCGAPDGVGETWWTASIPQSLLFMNGEVTATTTSNPTSESHVDWDAALLLDPTRTPVERLTRTYLATLGRLPAPAEAARVVALATAHPDGDAVVIDDLVWALLNCSEFQTNH